MEIEAKCTRTAKRQRSSGLLFSCELLVRQKSGIKKHITAAPKNMNYDTRGTKETSRKTWSDRRSTGNEHLKYREAQPQDIASGGNFVGASMITQDSGFGTHA